MSDAAELLQRLIRCDTTNPPGRKPRSRRPRRLAAGPRISSEIEEVAPERANLIARVKFGPGGPRIVLNTHFDVVPAGEGWSHPPFAGAIADGRVDEGRPTPKARLRPWPWP